MQTAITEDRSLAASFRHEALFYAGEDEFVDKTTSFIRDGLSEGEPTLVLVIPWKIELLRSSLGPDAHGVLFADMATIGRNPARIIPVWREFIDENASTGAPARGIAEPIWPGRNVQELVESQRHESLLNVAFDADPAWILCPYDTQALAPDVIQKARLSHPLISANGRAQESIDFRGPAEIGRPFDDPLPAPPKRSKENQFGTGQLDLVRAYVLRLAASLRVPADRIPDLVLAVDELAANSMRHAGGGGSVRGWREQDEVVFEVADSGHLEDPLAGRETPGTGAEHGFGLWLVNQVCDLVQVRSSSSGTVVRLHMSL